jgi:hypothetical protein
MVAQQDPGMFGDAGGRRQVMSTIVHLAVTGNATVGSVERKDHGKRGENSAAREFKPKYLPLATLSAVLELQPRGREAGIVRDEA